MRFIDQTATALCAHNGVRERFGIPMRFSLFDEFTLHSTVTFIIREIGTFVRVVLGVEEYPAPRHLMSFICRVLPSASVTGRFQK